MNIAHTAWKFPALLDYRSGTQQPNRNGCASDIRAGLAALLRIGQAADGTARNGHHHCEGMAGNQPSGGVEHRSASCLISPERAR